MKKWITFDLDETIMQNPFKKYVFPEIVTLIQDSYNKDLDVMELIYDEHLLRMSDNEVLESYDWDDIVAKIIEELGLDIQIDVEDIVLSHSISPKIYLLEDNMLENLRKIKKAGYSLAAATNGYYKYQIPVLRGLKLDKVFDKIITSDLAGFAKPDIRMLHEIMKSDWVAAHVGDRIDHDMLMANNLGITSVFINKSLPNKVLELSLDDRRNDGRVIGLCEDKWKEENKYRDISFSKKCIPDIVVASIEELANRISVLEV